MGRERANNIFKHLLEKLVGAQEGYGGRRREEVLTLSRERGEDLDVGGHLEVGGHAAVGQGKMEDALLQDWQQHLETAVAA